MTMLKITETARHVLTAPLGWLVLVPVFVAIAAALYATRPTLNIRITLRPRRLESAGDNLVHFPARRAS